jgi:hypothetical protein
MKRRGARGFGLLLGLVPVIGIAIASATGQDPKPDEAGGLVGNAASKTYHRPECPLARRLPAKAKVDLADAEAAREAGYRPCPQCKPPSPEGDPAPDKAARAPRKTGRPAAKPAAGERLAFTRDIAPILAGNCLGCHNAQQKRGELNMSTFEGLMTGSKSGPVIVPGQPAESLLVELVEERKMPRGDRRLTDDAIAKLRRWVQQGALLDAGANPTAGIETLVPSPEQLRREALAQVSEDERDRRLEAKARERWTQAGQKDLPKATPSPAFVLFGDLPDDRAKAALRVLEAQRLDLLRLLGPELAGPLDGPEKVSVYVFREPGAYTEFVRGVERREIELGTEAHARLTGEAPYLAAVDPLRGGEEPKAARPRPGAARKGEEPTGPTRSLSGLLAEALGAGTVASNAKAPRWAADGVGAWLAARVEPRSPYITSLRHEAAEQIRLGWTTRVTEALADQGAPEVIRGVGLSFCEWQANRFAPVFPTFLREITKRGGMQLDAVIRDCFGMDVTRDVFLQEWGGFVAAAYGRR